MVVEIDSSVSGAGLNTVKRVGSGGGGTEVSGYCISTLGNRIFKDTGEVNGPVVGTDPGVGIHDSEVFSFTGVGFRIPNFGQFIFKGISQGTGGRRDRELFSLGTGLRPSAVIGGPEDRVGIEIIRTGPVDSGLDRCSEGIRESKKCPGGITGEDLFRVDFRILIFSDNRFCKINICNSKRRIVSGPGRYVDNI